MTKHDTHGVTDGAGALPMNWLSTELANIDAEIAQWPKGIRDSFATVYRPLREKLAAAPSPHAVEADGLAVVAWRSERAGLFDDLGHSDWRASAPAGSVEPLVTLASVQAAIAHARREVAPEVTEPVYKAVERILDENSAWIARPNDEVTKRVAFAATVAARALSAKEAEEDAAELASERTARQAAEAELARLTRERDDSIAREMASEDTRQAAKEFEQWWHEAQRRAEAAEAERDAAREELDAFKACHGIGKVEDGYRELVWRDASAFYEDEGNLVNKAKLIAAEAERDRLRDLVERARHIIPLHSVNWHFEARAALEAQPVAPASGGAAPVVVEADGDAARDVQAERRRQIEAEGWTPDHDDQHTKGELLDAAISYMRCAFLERSLGSFQHVAPRTWPWGIKAWKPKDHRSNLVRAGALLLAEIERLDRLVARQAVQPAASDEGEGR